MARGMTRGAVLVLACVCAVACAAMPLAAGARVDRAAVQGTVERLAAKVINAQVKEDKKYMPPIQWAQLSGTWKSAVHFNFHGSALLQWVRRNFGIDDSNMFVTTWILDALLTAQDLDSGVHVPADVVQRSVDTLLQFQDKNRPGANVYSFWRQSKVKNAWMAAPENLNNVLKTEGSFAKVLHAFLHALHMDAEWEKIAPLLDFPKEFVTAFRIPADADDSSCAMAMGAQLRRAAARYPAAAQKWAENNPEAGMARYAETLQKYAYKPFSGDASAASIDPRTYYYLHDMLTHNVSSTDTSFAVVTTWMTNIAEAEHGFESGIAMPFNVNNLDASVSANTLCGTTLHALADVDKAVATWYDADMQKLLVDTAQYVAWSVEHGVVETRPDLLFMYYPPTYDVYMFMARTLQALEAAGDAVVSKAPALRTIKARFASALRGAGTKQLLDAMSSGKEGGEAINFWDDFLGDADKVFGKAVKHGDDRLFTTSVVVNALLDTWTRPGAGGKGREWVAGTPAAVRDAVAGAVQFLHGGFNSFELRRDNAFFSGSVKVAHDFPFNFPSNLNMYLNGTHVDPQGANPDSLIDATLLSAMNGVVSDAEYKAMLEKTWYGNHPPPFPGYNAQNGGLIFWSSRPLTEAFGVLALAKAQHVM